jgi:hypothetical protein
MVMRPFLPSLTVAQIQQVENSAMPELMLVYSPVREARPGGMVATTHVLVATSRCRVRPTQPREWRVWFPVGVAVVPGSRVVVQNAAWTLTLDVGDLPEPRSYATVQRATLKETKAP